MRTPIMMGLMASVIAVPAVAEPGDGPCYVNLNSPDSLARLAATNPEELGKVVAIMARIQRFGGGEWRNIEADFHATSGFSSPIVRTTYPPQVLVSFTLGNTTYHGWTNLDLRARLKALEAKR